MAEKYTDMEKNTSSKKLFDQITQIYEEINIFDQLRFKILFNESRRKLFIFFKEQIRMQWKNEFFLQMFILPPKMSSWNQNKHHQIRNQSIFFNIIQIYISLLIRLLNITPTPKLIIHIDHEQIYLSEIKRNCQVLKIFSMSWKKQQQTILNV